MTDKQAGEQRGIFQTIGKEVGFFFEQTYDWADKGFQEARPTLDTWASQLNTTVTNVNDQMNNTVTNVNSQLNTTVSNVNDQVNNTVTNVNKQWNTVFDQVVGQWSTMFDNMNNLGDSIMAMVGGFLGGQMPQQKPPRQVSIANKQSGDRTS